METTQSQVFVRLNNLEILKNWQMCVRHSIVVSVKTNLFARDYN